MFLKMEFPKTETLPAKTLKAFLDMGLVKPRNGPRAESSDSDSSLDSYKNLE